jgi:hypothetical protein
MDSLKSRFERILQGKDVKLKSRAAKTEYEEEDDIEEEEDDDSDKTKSESIDDVDGQIVKLYLLSKLKQQVKSNMKGDYYGKR